MTLPRILVVDDAPAVLQLMLRTLEEVPADAIGAGSVREAISASGPFDLLILDRRLPNGDGRQIAAHWATVPTIYVSGYQQGVDLCKPFTAGQLLELVRSRLGGGP